jgi:hypothetical protein
VVTLGGLRIAAKRSACILESINKYSTGPYLGDTYVSYNIGMWHLEHLDSLLLRSYLANHMSTLPNEKGGLPTAFADAFVQLPTAVR